MNPSEGPRQNFRDTATLKNCCKCRVPNSALGPNTTQNQGLRVFVSLAEARRFKSFYCRTIFCNCLVVELFFCTQKSNRAFVYSCIQHFLAYGFITYKKCCILLQMVARCEFVIICYRVQRRLSGALRMILTLFLAEERVYSIAVCYSCGIGQPLENRPSKGLPFCKARPFTDALLRRASVLTAFSSLMVLRRRVSCCPQSKPFYLGHNNGVPFHKC